MKATMSHPRAPEFHQAMLAKDSTYDGTFFVGVTSTGIFCRPACAAKTPRLENCEFFETAQQAMLAGYRACKRCHPTYPAGQSVGASPDTLKMLITAVEDNPSKRWKDSDISALGLNPATVRRQFRKRFGLTFVAYARARRMGLGLKAIRAGTRVIEAQLESGYESGSGFRDAFSKIMGTPPSAGAHATLFAGWLTTPLGPMLALADETALHLLEFTDRRGLEKEIITLRTRYKTAIVPGETAILQQTQSELDDYFAGTRTIFTVPLKLYGSAFQQAAMQALLDIPYGQTRSYAAQASILNKPTAIRAVARANGANQLAIIVPCHRVVGSNGHLTGYAGGLARKHWLLEHEQKYQP